MAGGSWRATLVGWEPHRLRRRRRPPAASQPYCRRTATAGWCARIACSPGIPPALQLALVLALLGCLLQPHGPHRPPPRWHVEAAVAEAPGDLNLTQLRWVSAWSRFSALWIEL